MIKKKAASRIRLLSKRLNENVIKALSFCHLGLMKKPCLEDRKKCINIQKWEEITDKRAMALKQREKAC